MEFANDSNGVRTSIYRASKDEQYYCPCCGSLMVQKRGSLIEHHFAHKSLENCVSYYDNKGAWHREMQDLFPEENREVFNDEFGRHIYDVLTNRGKIIEFQNSPMSYDDFWKRTDDYVEYTKKYATPKMAWIFNYVSRNFYVVGKTKRGGVRRRRIKWYRPTKYFEEYKAYEADFDMWFRIRPFILKPSNMYASKRYQDAYYVKISGLYNEGVDVYGDVYTEPEFKKMIINF